MKDPEPFLQFVAGHLKANNAMFSALIASHPSPEKLRALWHASKPEWIDALDEIEPLGEAAKRAYLLRLAVLSGEVDAAAGAP